MDKFSLEDTIKGLIVESANTTSNASSYSGVQKQFTRPFVSSRKGISTLTIASRRDSMAPKTANESEDLSELSTKTMSSYVDKSKPEKHLKKAVDSIGKDEKTVNKETRKGYNRLTGIERAKDKMNKPDEVDEEADVNKSTELRKKIKTVPRPDSPRPDSPKSKLVRFAEIKNKIIDEDEKKKEKTDKKGPKTKVVFNPPLSRKVIESKMEDYNIEAFINRALDFEEARKNDSYSNDFEIAEKYMGFEKLKKSIAGKHDTSDPSAVAAAVGRKKYGKEKYQKMAAAGKRHAHEELDSFSDEDIENIIESMSFQDYEMLDELSRDTLRSYLKKSKSDASDAWGGVMKRALQGKKPTKKGMSSVVSKERGIASATARVGKDRSVRPSLKKVTTNKEEPKKTETKSFSGSYGGSAKATFGNSYSDTKKPEVKKVSKKKVVAEEQLDEYRHEVSDPLKWDHDSMRTLIKHHYERMNYHEGEASHHLSMRGSKYPKMLPAQKERYEIHDGLHNHHTGEANHHRKKMKDVNDRLPKDKKVFEEVDALFSDKELEFLNTFREDDTTGTPPAPDKVKDSKKKRDSLDDGEPEENLTD